jgi:serine/threonine protein kinase
MSPELLAPDMFGLKKSRPTKESDCYALGMTIYEILSGQVPFALFKSSVVIRKVAAGERPERPQGDDGRHFTDGVWGVMQRSWELQPSDRISARVILMGLEGNPTPAEQPSNASEDVEADRDDRSDSSDSDSGAFSLFFPRHIPDYPRDTIDPPTARGDNGPPVPPKTGDPKLGRVVSLVSNTRRFLKNITKGLDR